MISRRGPARQEGMALIAMLILSAIILISMGGIFYRHQLDMASAHRVFTGEQAILLALSGEHWVADLLREDAQDSEIDALDENWAQRIPVLPVEGGTLTGCILDLQGRLNLNNLAIYDEERWSRELGNISSSFLDTYLNLLAMLELSSDDSRAAVIVDWIDADNELIFSGSAEDPEYLSQQPSHLAANQMLVSLNEVAGLAGYSAVEIVQLRPFVSVLPRVTPINVNTATPQVLTALMPFVDDSIVEAVVSERPFDSSEDFHRFLAEQTGYLSESEVIEQLPGQLIDVQSEFFGLVAEVEIGGASMRLFSTLYRAQGGEVRVISRELDAVPSVELNQDQQSLLASPCVSTGGQDVI